jgi:colicin import membrane protein
MQRMTYLFAFLSALIINAAFPVLVSAQDKQPNQANLSLKAFQERYPKDSIRSTGTADRALQESKQMRAQIENTYLHEQRVCFPKFFSSSCMERAKDARREALASVHSVEIEANAFKRRANAAERDREVTEKQTNWEKDSHQREEDLQRKNAEPSKEVPVESEADKQKRLGHEDANRVAQEKRVAEHDAKLKQLQEQDAADAGKRAENVAAYEKKVHEAEERQREVAEKKAQKNQQ